MARNLPPVAEQLPILRKPTDTIHVTKGTPMKRAGFAKQLPKNFTEQEFVNLMNHMSDESSD
ncbi:hypothetical protein SAMN04488117_10399 [Celeribacter baekdonensis]|uniref:Uncharacterized protein n=1 Tax=Celeribacter baekdonensis TaxID=875171 RepID=A0A1G7JK31_9RHOB|nr:hypothetical protein [Celeribacter baekdonensis]SDF24819.1 hypothetical protein SAMN04488117_10399 [Celeribacter baekdonensis]